MILDIVILCTVMWVVCVGCPGSYDAQHRNPLYCRVGGLSVGRPGSYDAQHRNPLYCRVGGLSVGRPGSYDAQHRNPLYCHGDADCIWELMYLSRHYHPSVALFAHTLLKACDGMCLLCLILYTKLQSYWLSNVSCFQSHEGLVCECFESLLVCYL